MPEYDQVLTSLERTEGFFQRETREYKDFRDSLSALNRAMQAVGNRAVTAPELQNLRDLTARAKENWDRYFSQITGRLQQGLENMDPMNPANPLSDRDKRRMQILNGMTGLLEGDLNALRNHNPSRNLNLEQIILENRGLNVDIRGRNTEKVGGASNTRLILEAGGQRGVFTEDYSGESPAEACEKAAQKYPHIGTVIRNLRNDPQYGFFWSLQNVSSPEDLYNKMMNGSDDQIRLNCQTLGAAIYRWGVPFPAELQDGTGKVWMQNPVFVRQMADAIYQICRAEETMTVSSLARFARTENVPRRNAAMSSVADRMGMPNLLARSKVTKIRTDAGEKTGVFQEWAKGVDIVSAEEKREILPDHLGKRHSFNSARVLKSAADLQALDFICGNVDRHAGNMLYQFEEIDGVQTLVGIQGIDNDASFGRVTGKIDESKMSRVDALRVMTKSTAETVLNLTKEDLAYSLYGLVKPEYIEAAWNRTELLQNKIRESMKVKWKSDTSMRTDAIHILDDASPAWEKLTARELRSNPRGGKDSEAGIFEALANAEKSMKTLENNTGIRYDDHTRAGVRKNYYKETEESLLYGYLYEVKLPPQTDQLSAGDIFALYRNRRTLHEDPAAVQKGVQVFNKITERFPRQNEQIQKDIGWQDKCDMIYIDGQPAAEYVRKYAPEHAGNKDYVKAQIAAAITSGRHHVDAVTLRTREDGTFQAEATELTADLSSMNGHERLMESSRETRRKGLIKDEDARIERQKAIEASVLQKANRAADQKVEQIMAQDPVRNRVFATIPYQVVYGKSQKQIEKRLDWEIDMLEKSRVQGLVHEKQQQKREQQFAAAREAVAPLPAAPHPAADGPKREHISLAALNLDPPKKQVGRNPQPQQNPPQQNQQNPQQQQQEQNGGRRRRNSVG